MKRETMSQDQWRRFVVPLLFFLTIFLFSVAVSAGAQTLKIKDGTILVGTIVAESFTIQTRYGVLKVPVSDMVQLIEGEIWLKNASYFFGTLAPETITVKTGYGDLKVSTEQVTWINFVGKERPKHQRPDP